MCHKLRAIEQKITQIVNITVFAHYCVYLYRDVNSAVDYVFSNGVRLDTSGGGASSSAATRYNEATA